MPTLKSRCVFGCSNAHILFNVCQTIFFYSVFQRLEWLEFIHISTIASKVSSALGFASMVLSVCEVN